MATLEDVQKLLSEFGQAYGVADLALDDAGDASIVVDETTTLFLHFDDGAERLILETPVGHVPATDEGDALELLMQANHLGFGTFGGTLALGPDDQVLLMRALTHKKLDHDVFGLAVQAHVEGVRFWEEQLEPGSMRFGEPDEGDAETEAESGRAWQAPPKPNQLV